MKKTFRQNRAIINFWRALLCVAIGFASISCGGDKRLPTSPPTPAAFVAFESQPAPSVVSGNSLGDVRVVLKTKVGEVAVGNRYFVVLSLSSPDTSAHLEGTTTIDTITGFATFSDLAVLRAGADFRLVARVYGLATAFSQQFSVTPGPPAKLRFKSFDNNLNAGTPLNAVVEVTDAGDNLAPSATNTVTLGYTYRGSSNFASAPDSIFGPKTATPVNGVARFSGFSFHRKGGYTLEATSPGLVSAATSNQLIVFAGPMSKLVFVTQPSDGTPNAPLPAFSVFPTDVYGNGRNTPSTVLQYTVTVSLVNNPSGAAVSGTTTVVESVNVPMFFRDVRIDKPGIGYTLFATTTGPVTWTAESAPFNIR